MHDDHRVQFRLQTELDHQFSPKANCLLSFLDKLAHNVTQNTYVEKQGHGGQKLAQQCLAGTQ